MNFIKEIGAYIIGNMHCFDDIYLKWKYSKYPNSKKKYLSVNELFKDKYKGERCFIIGNGPSINKCDLTYLKDEYTFTVNQFPRSEKFGDVVTDFHMWADERFFNIDANRPEDMELIEVMKLVSKRGNRPVVFYKLAARSLIKEYKLDKILNIHYFDDMSILGGSDKLKQIDFSKPVPRFSTVCHYLICLAVYMGFSKIILLGCDCTGFLTLANSYDSNSAEYQYAYEMTDNERKRLKRNNMKCTIQQELRWYANIFDEYEKLYKYCSNNDVELCNATNGGVLTSIPRVNYLSLFDKK